MARRQTLGKKRKSYRKTSLNKKTRNKKNKKNKKTVRKTRRMRGGGGGFFNEYTGEVAPIVANITNREYKHIISTEYMKYDKVIKPGNILMFTKSDGTEISPAEINLIIATKVNKFIAAAEKLAADKAAAEQL